jgi:Terminase small subunit
LQPRAQAYREAGWNTSDDDGAYSHACRLERRPGVKARIAYLSRDAEGLIATKRERIESHLWAIHEADIGNFFEIVEIAKSDKDSKLTAEDGKMLTVKKQRPKFINDLPPEFRKLIEDVTVDRNGNFVPRLYSKAEANRELRKMHNIGAQTDRLEGDVSRLSDAELIAQLADTAKELEIDINLNYAFAQLPPATETSSPPVVETDKIDDVTADVTDPVTRETQPEFADARPVRAARPKHR